MVQQDIYSVLLFFFSFYNVISLLHRYIFILLKEVDIEKQPLLRLIVLGKKRLPNPSERSRPFWGFVELVTTNVDDIKTALKGGPQ